MGLRPGAGPPGGNGVVSLATEPWAGPGADSGRGFAWETAGMERFSREAEGKGKEVPFPSHPRPSRSLGVPAWNTAHPQPCRVRWAPTSSFHRGRKLRHVEIKNLHERGRKCSVLRVKDSSSYLFCTRHTFRSLTYILSSLEPCQVGTVIVSVLQRNQGKNLFMTSSSS